VGDGKMEKDERDENSGVGAAGVGLSEAACRHAGRCGLGRRA
jgi:hypothetical protein